MPKPRTEPGQQEKEAALAAAVAAVKELAKMYGYSLEDTVLLLLEELACEGHESLEGAHMGETVYCDGSCR